LQRSDIELLRAAADGDSAAFHELVDRHSDTLFRAAVALTTTRADAEDLLQETLLGAYRGIGGFNGKAAVKTWLNSILIRQAAKGWRRAKHHRRARSIQPADQDQPLDDASLHVRSGSDAVDHRMDLMSVLKTLAQEHQDVIVLRELQGLSYEEIAEALQIPRGTVDSRLHRARAELRQRLAVYGVAGPKEGSS
jgi:RNA polymerase sigma-70 factor, ECF subfamily